MTVRSLGCASILVAAALATADNAALTSGGQPSMLKGHKSVTMESEVVRLVVHWNRVDADCSFVFANHGKACSVNMGFPDFGLWAYDYPKKKPSTIFNSYNSFVDGKRAKTNLVLDADKRHQWQTKTVSFPTNAKRIVREVYSTEIGGVAISQTEAWGMASYLLHTGASWNGPIGKATITVTFAPDSEVSTPIDLITGDLNKVKPEAISAQLRKPGGIIVASGPGRPAVHGNTVTFVCENLRPTEKDDILVGFSFPKRLMRQELQKVKKKSGG